MLSVQKMGYWPNILYPLAETRLSRVSVQLYLQEEYDLIVFIYTVLVQVATSISYFLDCVFSKCWPLEMRRSELVDML